MKETGEFPSPISKPRMAVLPLAAILLTTVLSLAGCTGFTPTQNDPDEDMPHETTVASSYDDVFEAIDAISRKQERQNQYSLDGGAGAVMEDSAASEAAPLSNSQSTSSAGEGYSETNVQVEGIDEGDIVKTDGDNIYMVAESAVIIAHAAGDATEEVARIALNDVTPLKDTLGGNPVYPQELYIDGDILAILYQYSPNSQEGYGAASSERAYIYPSYRNITEVACFDISDASKPKYLGSFGQDGYYASSRLQDGILYLISNYPVYDTSGIEREEPITYIPLFYTGAEFDMVEPHDICILPDYSSVNYAIIASIDLAEGERIDQQSILGSSNTVYMSPGNLYLAEGIYEEIELNSYQDGSFTVKEYRNTYSTRIAKLSLTEGAIRFVTDAIVPGNLLNQFSMDEYDGHLRVVTTVNTYRYRVIEDGRGSIDDYRSYENEPTTNALYVLDSQLHIVGRIDGLAEDERVYSVRFDGPVGYFVTFKQVDPLFAVDLSNPVNPTIKSELKIPGFSTYMHPYSENRLFGLGMAADESGRTQGLKLSMFDTSNPYDISEKHTLHLGEGYSAALYDHKAIFIDQAHDIIGFQTDSGYVIYGYSDEDGFYLRQKFDNGTDQNNYYGYYTFNARGLYIGSYFYLCAADSIGVYGIDAFEEVKQVPIPGSASPDYDILPLDSSTSSGSSASSRGSGMME